MREFLSALLGMGFLLAIMVALMFGPLFGYRWITGESPHVALMLGLLILVYLYGKYVVRAACRIPRVGLHLEKCVRDFRRLS